jgi:hypothetical protein
VGLVVQGCRPLKNHRDTTLKGGSDVCCRWYEATVLKIQEASGEVFLCQRWWIIEGIQPVRPRQHTLWRRIL